MPCCKPAVLPPGRVRPRWSRVMPLVVAGLLPIAAACGGGADAPTGPAQPVSITVDFREGAQGWTAGFADYPVADSALYALEAGIRPLPAGRSGSGFLLAGTNRSDDLFMFVARRVTGLAPGALYQATASVSFLSAAGTGCVGAGGAPGEAVIVKFGAVPFEPRQAGFGINLDKGNQSVGGSQAVVLGHVGIDGLGCDGGQYAERTLATPTGPVITVRADAAGAVWLLVGTDSGFEGRTALYYTRLSVTLTPR